jgi:hypothetical protein
MRQRYLVGYSAQYPIGVLASLCDGEMGCEETEEEMGRVLTGFCFSNLASLMFA